MSKKKDKLIQVLVDEDTALQLNRLIVREALEKNEKPRSTSAWLRELIIDTLTFDVNNIKPKN